MPDPTGGLPAAITNPTAAVAVVGELPVAVAAGGRQFLQSLTSDGDSRLLPLRWASQLTCVCLVDVRLSLLCGCVLFAFLLAFFCLDALLCDFGCFRLARPSTGLARRIVVAA